MDELDAIIEALVFASETPLSLDRLVEVIDTSTKAEIAKRLREIERIYQERNRGFLLKEVGGGFQFRTRGDLAPWIRKLRASKSSLTPAAVETLTIIAYRQPVLKAEIDKIRGVDTGGSLKKLLERKLVRIMGRKDVPGKPIIYGTTKKFLEVFDLKDLSELPTLNELKELQE